MLRHISNSKFSKALAVWLAITILAADFFRPTNAYALTGGPSQAEYESFEPATTTEMVDLFTGDFNYNIPLMDVDGYPVNLAYHANPTADQEASWVGLGWNINVGSISRSMRGLPDDFSGDAVRRKINLKPTETKGAMLGAGVELFGKEPGPFSGGLSLGLGVVHSNYKGWGFQFEFDATGGISVGNSIKGSLNGGLGLKANTQEGADISANLSLSGAMSIKEKASAGLGVNIGGAFNSRQGLLYRSFGVTAFGGSKKVGVGINRIAVVPAGSQTYIPNLSVGMESYSIGLDFKAGQSGCAGDLWYGSLKGFYSQQSIKNYEKDAYFKAYGYLNSQNGDGANSVKGLDAMHDFNREKDGVFHENAPAMPVTNYTYDLFSATAQGLGMVFRGHRSDVGTVYDDISFSNSTGGALSGELGLGLGLHVGVNASTIFYNAKSGLWSADDNHSKNNSLANVQFIDGAEATTDGYEASYMKAVGERTVADESYQQAIGNQEAVYFGLLKIGSNDVGVKNMLFDNSGNLTNVQGKIYRTKRDKRNESIIYLSAAEADKVGLQQTIPDYAVNTYDIDPTGNLQAANTISRTSIGPSHHISEVTVFPEGGGRYVYGIPVYNHKQVEATFNVSGRTIDCNQQTVTYAAGDNSTSNSLGLDNYFESKELPPYAHSYLLTSYLSSDYIDRTGNGPTTDDLGNYTKFNYSRITGYKWRTPFAQNQASYNEGFKSDTKDDKGSYVYGEKDIWYLHSIETKNYIAEFVLSATDRYDGYGVAGEDGGINTGVPLKKLEKIILYAKKDKMINGAGATPIKTVHFEYDYSLCPYVYNNINTENSTGLDNGKLTLKKVYFTYGKSEKGRLNPYKFAYADPDHNMISDAAEQALYNHAYDGQAYDRWGNFKPNNGCVVALNNHDYPYVHQDKTQADINSAQWNLHTIQLPSGGQISIDYESDDYGYVQDKRAAQMFKVLGLNNTAANSTTNLLHEALGLGWRINNYLVVDLGNTIPASTVNPDQYFRDEHLGGLTQLYYRFLVKIGYGANEYDYVPGYADIDREECIVDPTSLSGGYYTRGIIKLNTVPIDDEGNSNIQSHPISKAAWQMGRLYLSQIIYPGSSPNGTGQSALAGLATLTDDFVAMALGVNRMLREKGLGAEVQLNESMIRLNNPDKKKLGGGSRVKQVVTKDAWSAMVNNSTVNSNENESEFGQLFDYTTIENGKAISSGVASYEPLMGGDENALRQPVPFSVENEFFPNDEFFMEEPIGESLFPSPVVGYSKITVRSLQYANVTRNSTGKVEYQFYTSRDYPIVTERTERHTERVKPKLLRRLLQIGVKDRMYLSQGYVIKLNDMHGKARSRMVYKEGQPDPISGVRYEYRSKQGLNKPELDNEVSVVSKDNVISSKVLGVDIDMITDARMSESDITGYSLGFNLDQSGCTILPVLMFWPSFTSEETRFNSIVNTKVVQQFGLLERVISYDNNSVVTSENVLYDEETGHVLLSKTTNEFEDAIYSFSYPAHWSYDRMASAYRNLGAGFLNAFDPATGLFSLSSIDQYEFIVPGDEIMIIEQQSGFPYTQTILPDRYWVSENSSGDFYLIKRDGTPATFTTTVDRLFKVIRSGRRNQQGISVGTLTSLANPVSGTALSLGNKVLNSSAVEMTDVRKIFNAPEGVENKGVSCPPNSANISNLLGLLDELASSGGDLYTVNTYPGVDLTVGDYAQYYNALSPYFTSGSDKWMVSQATSTTLTAAISCRECTGCSVTLECPEAPACSVSWSSITGFTNLSYLYDPLNPTLGPGYEFSVIAHFADGSTKVLHGSTSCIPLASCKESDIYSNCNNAGDIINPYVTGNRGVWYSHLAYSYKTGRDQGVSQSVPDIREDGTYSTYKPFWLYHALVNTWMPVHYSLRSDYDAAKPLDNWVLASEQTKVSQYGNPHEMKDALGNYASLLTGYNHTLSIATAVNAPYRHIAYDGFEDYGYTVKPCENAHFNFYQHRLNLKEGEAHTGKYSLVVAGNSSLKTSREIKPAGCTAVSDDVPYTIKECDCMGTFSPYSSYATAQKFVLSVWAKEASPTLPCINYAMDVAISIKDASTSVVTAISPLSTFKGNIIDGWQKLELVFEIPANTPAGSIDVSLVNNASRPMYFDDIRIQPFNASMKASVYDPFSLRLMAELDDRNYATLYEYDKDGILVRVKQETEKGIYTIQESRTGLRKK